MNKLISVALTTSAVLGGAVVMSGCAGNSGQAQPTVTVTAPAPATSSTPSLADVDENGQDIALPESKRALLQAAWDTKSPALQREMCTLWLTQPDEAWKEFRVSAEASQFTRMNFDVFFALACAPHLSGR